MKAVRHIVFLIAILMPATTWAGRGECSKICGRGGNILEGRACMSFALSLKHLSLDVGGYFKAAFGCVKCKIRQALRRHGRDPDEDQFLKALDEVISNIADHVVVDGNGNATLRRDNEAVRAILGISSKVEWNDYMLTAKKGIVIEYYDKQQLARLYSKLRINASRRLFGKFRINIAEVTSAKGVMVYHQRKNGDPGRPIFRAFAGARIQVLDKLDTGYLVEIPRKYRRKDGTTRIDRNSGIIKIHDAKGVSIERRLRKHLLMDTAN